ncbi:MAG: NADH-quinone oxidoreductase subunit NuoH [Bacillati bacterium ANGP1]|uniref:NADH-quinone oxidoreductase subunit H n=2 Tax=Candidatus Segetimicrobium genomatis TaxID=2569760 RepID=A0A537J519_9BACT|nr:MAG: NADH-quinone oxidoreductase subunit NuoH [Terrabacteria group bacterium ANGP1]
MLTLLLVDAIRSAIILGGVLTAFAYVTLLERRLLARFQLRVGPNRVGPLGLLQPLADGIKLIFKESFIPARADRFVFLVAPIISVVAALFVYAVIPIGPPVRLFGREVPLVVADPNAGILLVLAASSIGVYGIILGGWASDSKYSLLGGLRSSAQVISYELTLGLAVLAVVMMAHSLSLVEIVRAQQSHPWFVVTQPVAFILFLVAGLAETNRAPFDLPEAEQELIGGYQTEYGGFAFAMFYLGEYVGVITMGALTATLFLGGWQGPPALPPVVWFLLKAFAVVFLFIWIRATLPRLRYDQLMGLGWKVLVPVGLANLALTAVVLVGRGGAG